MKRIWIRSLAVKLKGRLWTNDKYVFAQLTAFLTRTQSNNFVRKYDGNRYVKQFTCWKHLLAMMFGQLSNRESLRDLIVTFGAHQAKQYHLGLGRNPITKATLAYANQHRDYRIIFRKSFVHYVFVKVPVSLFCLFFIKAIDESCFYPHMVCSEGSFAD